MSSCFCIFYYIFFIFKTKSTAPPSTKSTAPPQYREYCPPSTASTGGGSTLKYSLSGPVRHWVTTLSFFGFLPTNRLSIFLNVMRRKQNARALRACFILLCNSFKHVARVERLTPLVLPTKTRGKAIAFF